MAPTDPGHVPDAIRARVAEAFRAEYARLVASVLRIVRDPALTARARIVWGWRAR